MGDGGEGDKARVQDEGKNSLGEERFGFRDGLATDTRWERCDKG
jgi:hypothetical protein